METRQGITYKIGVTGNICTGKTQVRNMLQRLGVSTLDAEDAALQVLADNPRCSPIRLTDYFGDDVLDSRGRLSKRRLAQMLHLHPEKRALFEDKIGPVVRREIKRFLYSPIGSYIRAVEAPTLLETDTRHLYDQVWMVSARMELQIERLIARDQFTAGEAQFLVDSQWPQSKKEGLSDRVIDNSNTIHETESQVKEVLDEIHRRVFKIGL